MGTYKVPQNVEAEDKILGPLSLKQFIYAMIGVGYGLLTFAILKPLSIALWVIFGLPPMLALLGLGLYQREDQPMETYLVAIVEFFVHPRTRFWQKEPIAEVFRLEPPPPKAAEVVRDPRQVRSQLAQLADLVDTRGWSAKQPELQEPEEVPVVDLQDRLGTERIGAPVAIGAAPEVTEDDDILSNDSATAQGLNVLIENTVKSVREEAVENMKARTAATRASGAAQTAPPRQAPSKPRSAAAAKASAGTAKSAAATTPPSTSGSTAPPSGDILKLAAEGGDLTVAQIAAQARRYNTTLAEGESVSLRHAEAS
ncbi:MAG TPA: PrgI family protein [Candidatus Saccharimonadales bacterium]|nr:PrgI family protein [Candidatus Saccharimonadales bacterium]